MVSRTINDGAITETGQSGALTTSADKVRVAVDCTAITGTLDITVEWSPDGTNWADASTPDALAQFTTEGVEFGVFDAKAPFHRLVYTVVTGPVTFKAVTLQ